MKASKVFFILIIMFVFISFIHAEKEINCNNYLVLGPIKLFTPINFSQKDSKVSPADIVSSDYFDNSLIKPKKDVSLEINGKTYKWLETSDNKFNNTSKTEYQLMYVSVYLQTDQYTKLKLKSNSNFAFEISLNGIVKIAKKSYSETDTLCIKDEVTTEIETEAGKHLITLKFILGKSEKIPQFLLKASVDSAFFGANVKFTTDPTRYTTFSDLLDNQKAKSVSISSDGKYALISLTKRNKSKNAQNNYFKIFDLTTNTEIQAFPGLTDLSSAQWSPTGSVFAYTSSTKNGTNLYIADLKTGVSKSLLEEVKEFSGFEWAPNGKFIIYNISETKTPDSKGVKKYNDMSDRYPWSASNSFLYYLDVNSGFKYQLTKGKTTTSLNSIAPDSKSFIYSESYFDPKNRPYSYSVYYLANLETGKVDSLFRMGYGGSAVFSPKGDKIAISGGPSEFNNIGLNVPDGVIPNDYDTQLFIYNLTSKSVQALTKDFNPSVSAFYWLTDNRIYITTTDGSRENLYSIDIDKNKFSKIDLGVETISSISFDKSGKKAIYLGASITTPNKVFTLDLQSNQYKLLFAPEAEEYSNIKLGKVEDFYFTNVSGKQVEGFIHYPPDFDETKEYPCIVYYYGGTSPVEREFEGRYPKNIWAANGYIVYILEPTGCYGYGQENSAVHVNDWGTVTAEEIITGTKELLKKYKFINPKKVGCIGASYGGFMTMNVITKTDIFSAAVSHAGISALSSYWGNGYWGYTYSSVATANSFPWNRKDIYVDNSSLFNADKINTPLLLLHGAADTNVPPGESMQMYTALKLLGKDVELIEVDAQDHHILDYDKRIQWSKSILAYFDKYLKGNDSWWKSLYKN